MKITRTWLLAAGLLLAACSDDSSGGNGGNGGSAGSTKLSFDDCNKLCTDKATACQAPAGQAEQICDPLCKGGVTQAQGDCLVNKPCQELSSISSPAGFEKVCPASTGSGGSGGSGGGSKFGDACKCEPDSSEGSGQFLCNGTGICTSGLSCVGTRTQGVDSGKCVGPTCCTSESDCATKIGTQASCGSDQVCACPFGDYECVGSTCTCAGGAAPSRGLCHPK